MIRIKDGVTPKNLVILAAAANTAQELALSLVVTSGTDGQHMTGSKHYTGEALDLRSRTLTVAQKQAVLRLMRTRLGTNYQMILEAPGQTNEHFHCEYDPPSPDKDVS